MHRPLLVTADLTLLDAVLTVCAERSLDVDVADCLGSALTGWAAASVVLLGADQVAGVALACSGRRLLPRRQVVLVTTDPDDPSVWRRAERAGAEWVVLLPEGGPWLLRELIAVAGADEATAGPLD